MDCHQLVAELKEPARRMQGLSALKTRYRPFICPLDMVLAEIPENARLYDIGCGSGTLLYLALQLRNTAVAHGYDVAEEAVQAAQAFQAKPEQFHVTLLKPEDTPPPLADYDTVTMVDVLHHLPPAQQDAFLHRTLENMAPGARLILKDIDASQVLGAWCNQLHDLILAREWVFHRKSREIVGLLESFGAVVEKVDYRWTLWYPHFQVVARKQAG